MKRIREWSSGRVRRLRAFLQRQAPYVLVVGFVITFLLVYFFNSIVISDSFGATGSAVAAAGRRHGGADGLPGRHPHHPALQPHVRVQRPQAERRGRDRRLDRRRPDGARGVFGAVLPEPGPAAAAAPAGRSRLPQRGRAAGGPIGDPDGLRPVQAGGDIHDAEGYPGTCFRNVQNPHGGSLCFAR